MEVGVKKEFRKNSELSVKTVYWVVNEVIKEAYSPEEANICS